MQGVQLSQGVTNSGVHNRGDDFLLPVPPPEGNILPGGVPMGGVSVLWALRVHDARTVF